MCYGGTIKESSGHGQCVVLVDPYSTGCCVAQEISKRGYELLVVWSDGCSDDMKTHVPSRCVELSYRAEIPQRKTVAETAEEVRRVAEDRLKLKIAACICGGESGVSYADALSEELGLLSNGTDIPHRRDKKMQQELVKERGLRSVRQAGGKDFSEVEEFLKKESYPVVVKPVESAGSDGVKLCHDFDEAKDHFHQLMNSQQQVGSSEAAVLCQEFLKGKEYVVDHVSRDGVHKTTMVWVYDKRAVNGASFVYFGLLPVDSDSPEAKVIIPYVRGVLDALGVKYGASHGEVMITSDGPCLVEMNCRAHGGDGNWQPLARGLTGGYSQVDATVDAYLDAEQFFRLPDKPPSPFKASGQEVTLVSFSKGTVRSTPGYEVIRHLPSFIYLETRVDKGSNVDYTIDLFTDIGSVILMHSSKDIVERDVQFIRYMEEINGFFEYETKLENLKRPRNDAVNLLPISEAAAVDDAGHRRAVSLDGPHLIRHMSNDRPELRGPLIKRMTTVDATKEAVIVVDPYSTGCCIAKEIINRTYNVIALWSNETTEEMKKHVPLSCTNLTYFAEVSEGGNLADTVKAVRAAAGTFKIVACICGGEQGVLLADALSEMLGVRTNGTVVAHRRDKKMQQELIKAAGLRSIRQAGGKHLAEVNGFLRNEQYPIVVKPVESAGSDGVKLCHNYDEAKDHFQRLMTSQRQVGSADAAVLCQEFLRGREYVVDHVSRDGVHKTVMVWVYDKRAVNGAAFVYFGLVPVDSNSPEARIVIPYVRGVLDALKFENGASHGEVVMTPDGPCLVEMNCRAHGGDGNWQPLARALTGGYTQVDATVDSYLDKEKFFKLPDKPPSPFKASGQEVTLVSFSRGTVKATPGYEEIKNLPSYVYLETRVDVGSEVDYTTDLFTDIGSVILMHPDKDVLKKDVDRIRQMERENLFFVYETRKEILRTPSMLIDTGKPGHRRIISSDRPEMFW